jgi:hypothetical protein
MYAEVLQDDVLWRKPCPVILGLKFLLQYFTTFTDFSVVENINYCAECRHMFTTSMRSSLKFQYESKIWIGYLNVYLWMQRGRTFLSSVYSLTL